MRPRGTLALAAASTLLLVTACTGEPATEPDSPHELAPPAPPAEEPIVTIDTFPAVVDPSVLETTPGATTRARTDEELQVSVTWPELGLDDLDDALRTAALEVAGSTLDPAADGQEINQTWSLLGADASVVGVMSDLYRLDADGTAATWRSTWFDAETSAVVENTALVEEPERLGEELRDALDGQVRVETEPDDVALAEAAPLLAFTENGELFVGFDEYQLTAGRSGRVTVTLTRETTDDLLSDLGERARDALVEPTAPPGAVSTGEDGEPQDPESPEVGLPSPSTDGEDGEGADGESESGAGAEGEEPAPVDCAAVDCVAITFEDGPSDASDDVLDLLAERDVPATFFVLGRQVATYPQRTLDIVEAGHEVGVHTWDHRNLTRLPSAHAQREIERTVTVLDEAGIETSLFRPPYGASDDAVLARAGALDLAQVLWTLDARDWEDDDSAAIARRVLAQARGGSIIALHETSPALVAALPRILTGLERQGLTPVTVSTLLGDVEPGTSYGEPSGD